MTPATKILINQMRWNKYLHEEGLEKYPEIVRLFDSDSEAMKLVKQVLLNDRVLRSVFMQVLPEEKTGKMEICNNCAVFKSCVEKNRKLPLN